MIYQVELCIAKKHNWPCVWSTGIPF